MSEDAGESAKEIDEELASYECSTEDINAMSIQEKSEMVKTFRLSMSQNSSPLEHRKIVSPVLNRPPNMDLMEKRLLSTGVSITTLKPKIPEDQDDIMVLEEIASPRNTLRRPPIHKLSDENISVKVADHNTPLKMLSPSLSSSVKARQSIKWKESTREEIPSSKHPGKYKQKVMHSNDYVNCRAEIYSIDPFSCVDTALSTLADTSQLPMRKKAIVPFYYSEHALSLKMEDYIALCTRKFGCDNVPSICYKQEEPGELVPTVVASTADLVDEESRAHYNLRHRTAPKRPAKFEFTVSDDSDSDTLVPSKKCNLGEDPMFSPTSEANDRMTKHSAQTTIGKTRANKLSLATSKMAAEQKVVASKEMVEMDDDKSSDSDVPGKEVCIPKLQYSSVVSGSASKWKTAKGKVSATPKVKVGNDEDIEAMNNLAASKSRQLRVKPSELVKPGPISGKNRRAGLEEGVSPQKSRRKPVNKKGANKDTETEEESEEKNIRCEPCKKYISAAEVEHHIHGPIEEPNSENEVECPICYDSFAQNEIVTAKSEKIRGNQ